MIGQKHDKQKPRMSLLPKGSLSAVIRVLEFGATKYQENNWKHVPEAKVRYYDAMQRHIEAWWNGEQKDPETGEHHLAHAICCGMFLWWFDDMDTKVLAGVDLMAKFVRKGDLPERGPIDQLGYQIQQETPAVILEVEKKLKPKCDCAHWKNSSFFHGETHACADCGGEVTI